MMNVVVVVTRRCVSDLSSKSDRPKARRDSFRQES